MTLVPEEHLPWAVWIGVMFLYLEFAWPRIAQKNPYGMWFPLEIFRQESSRRTRVICAFACIWIGLRGLVEFPEALRGSLDFGFPVAVLHAFVHDLSLHRSGKLPVREKPSPVEPARDRDGNPVRKRRRHRPGSRPGARTRPEDPGIR